MANEKRLVFADDLEKVIAGYPLPYWVETMLRNRISQLPTVDAAPVVRGEWETHNQVDSVFYCSECKLNVSGFERRWLNYCPNCGARMDGGTE